ncbi:MAG: hypothetical protein IKD72_09675 [Clostridia bacterium]|nr:hypothetical protein [Clostridia bacterium]
MFDQQNFKDALTAYKRDFVPIQWIKNDEKYKWVRTLDLNCEFSKIAAQLDAIVMEYFGEQHE